MMTPRIHFVCLLLALASALRGADACGDASSATESFKECLSAQLHVPVRDRGLASLGAWTNLVEEKKQVGYDAGLQGDWNDTSGHFVTESKIKALNARWREVRDSFFVPSGGVAVMQLKVLAPERIEESGALRARDAATFVRYQDGASGREKFLVFGITPIARDLRIEEVELFSQLEPGAETDLRKLLLKTETGWEQKDPLREPLLGGVVEESSSKDEECSIMQGFLSVWCSRDAPSQKQPFDIFIARVAILDGDAERWVVKASA